MTITSRGGSTMPPPTTTATVATTAAITAVCRRGGGRRRRTGLIVADGINCREINKEEAHDDDNNSGRNGGGGARPHQQKKWRRRQIPRRRRRQQRHCNNPLHQVTTTTMLLLLALLLLLGTATTTCHAFLSVGPPSLLMTSRRQQQQQQRITAEAPIRHHQQVLSSLYGTAATATRTSDISSRGRRNSYRQSTKAAASDNTMRMAVATSPTNNIPPISMFLPSSSSINLALTERRRRIVDNKEQQPIISSSPIATTTTTASLPSNFRLEKRRSRSRGVLGFRIDPMGSSGDEAGSSTDSNDSTNKKKSTSSTTTALSVSSSPSNVDTASWNLPDQKGYSEERKHRIFLLAANTQQPSSSSSTLPPVVDPRRASASSASAPIGGSTSSSADSGGGVLLDNTGVFSWFPWIPTRTQIDSLGEIRELRLVCAERGLSQVGNKSQLRARLWEWTTEQQRIAALRQRQSLSFLQPQQTTTTAPESTASREDGSSSSSASTSSRRKKEEWSDDDKEGSRRRKGKEHHQLEANSLAEWTRTVDLKPLLKRREAIHREKNEGKRAYTTHPNNKDNNERRLDQKKKEAVPPTVEDLTKMFLREPSKSNNVQVKELYMAAKYADQRGDRALAKNILLQLKETTPHDGRLYRRLARMEKEEGNMSAARATLQEGLRLQPNNAYLWHGLGQIAASDHDAKKYWRRAIEVDPTFPNPYHALGTLEHTHGRVALAMKTLKTGLEYCPTNHRLHHALGDLYRDAKMLEMAENSYRKALKHSREVSHGFALTALAYVAYEHGQVDKCRSRLRKALTLNNGRQANAWLALAQMEEAEGNIDAARAVCIAGLAKYERSLFERSRNIKFRKKKNDLSVSDDPVTLRNSFLKKVPVYRSGDRFFNVYRNWARLEERYGTVDSVEEVYGRATSAFPHEWRLYVDWAQYYAKLRIRNRAREIFSEACTKTANRHADPYRHFAEFEMSLGNYADARKILYQGAMAMTQSSDGALGNRCGLAELFHMWAVCEWHLDELSRAEVLFDHALRMTDDGEEGSKLRSFILYSIARLEHFQGEHLLAQHSIGLCLKENLMPGGNSKIWDLWAEVATAMGNKNLAQECFKQAEQARSHEDENGSTGLSRVLSVSSSPGVSAFGLSRMKGQNMEGLMRRDPWHQKIFGTHQPSDFFSGAKLPATPQ